MYAKGGKGSAVPSDSQAREKLALYVYEYLLHVGAQKSAQTFLSEIRWEKNITLGEPPGFLHSWWCVFWDLYCAAPDRREACEHSSEAKAFQDYSAAAAPSPVMGSMGPNDAMAAGPMAPGFFQGPPGSQPPSHNLNAPMMGPHVQVRTCDAPPLRPHTPWPSALACTRSQLWFAGLAWRRGQARLVAWAQQELGSFEGDEQVGGGADPQPTFSSPSCHRGSQGAPGPPCGCRVSLLWASLAPSPSSLAPWTPPHVLRGIRAWAQCKG